MPNQPKSPSSLRVVITASDGGLAEKLPELKRRGFKVDSVLEHIGAVTGQVRAENLKDLRATPGISVELDEQVQIPPPDSPLQ